METRSFNFLRRGREQYCLQPQQLVTEIQTVAEQRVFSCHRGCHGSGTHCCSGGNDSFRTIQQGLRVPLLHRDSPAPPGSQRAEPQDKIKELRCWIRTLLKVSRYLLLLLLLPCCCGFIYCHSLTIPSNQASALVTADQELEGFLPMALQDAEEL